MKLIIMTLALMFCLPTIKASDIQRETITPKQIKELIRYAKRGEPAAQTMVAILYLRGDMLTKNEERAMNYFHKAATRGEPVAQYQLYRIYLREGDREQALKFLELSAKNKYGRAVRNLEMIKKGVSLDDLQVPETDHRMVIKPSDYNMDDFLKFLAMATANTDDRGGTGTRIRGRSCTQVGNCKIIGYRSFHQQSYKYYDRLIEGIGKSTFANLRLETEPVFGGPGGRN